MAVEKFKNYLKTFNSHLSGDPLNEDEYGILLDLIIKRFSKLTNEEKVFFLLSLNNQECKIISDITDDITDDDIAIEKANKIAMIQLRTWIIKVFIIAMLSSIILVGILNSVFRTSINDTIFGETFNAVYRIIKVLFN